jgi:hypothetical protein
VITAQKPVLIFVAKSEMLGTCAGNICRRAQRGNTIINIWEDVVFMQVVIVRFKKVS